MAKKKSLLKSAAFSCLAMGLSAAVIAGTTFAWFNDRATTPENKIVAGNLKVQLQYNSAAEGEEAKWESSEFHALFEDTDLWEPGKMVVSEPFRVANVGSLALWYDLSVAMEDIVTVTIDEVEHGLSEVVKFKVVNADEAPTGADRAKEWKALTDAEASGKLLKEESTDAMVAVLYWEPTNHDNDYNVDVDAEPLETHFCISVLASQVPEENDSFGNDYDKDASAKPVDKVNQAVVNGVDKANNALKDAGIDEVNFSDLKYDASSDSYNSVISIVTDDLLSIDLETILMSVGTAIINAVEEEVANIQSIQIYTAEPVVFNGSYEGFEPLDPENYTENWFFKALSEAAQKAGLSTTTLLTMDGLSVPVYITSTDGATATYSLTMRVFSEGGAQVHEAVVAGVERANNALKAVVADDEDPDEVLDLSDKIYLSPLEHEVGSEFIIGEDVYASTVTFDIDAMIEGIDDPYDAQWAVIDTMLLGYRAIADEIQAAIEENQTEILSIQISDRTPILMETIIAKGNRSWLTNELMNWLLSVDIDTGAETTPAMLNGLYCDVVITPVTGNAVTYRLYFAMVGEMPVVD